MSATAVRRQGVYIKRRTGAIRQVAGFTSKPDGIKRARMIDAIDGSETRVRVDQFSKTYAPLY